MSNDNTLPEDVQNQIEQEAEAYKQQPYYKNGDPLSVAPQIYLKRGYIVGATEYASKAKAIFDKILALENQDHDNEITIGPELINEIKSFLDGSK